MIFSFLTLSMSRNLFFFVVSRSCSVSGDLENSGLLPVLQEVEGTDDWVLWIFVISSFPTFSRSMYLYIDVFL